MIDHVHCCLRSHPAFTQSTVAHRTIFSNRWPPKLNKATSTNTVRVDSVPHDGEPGHARSRIVFADETTLEVLIHSARLLFALPAPRGPDWLLVSGVECSQCDAPEVVWIFRGVPGVLQRHSFAYLFPGALTEGGDDETPYFRSRLFVGACADDGGPAAVWLEETLQPDSARSRVTRILRGTPTLYDTTLAWTDATERQLALRVQSGRCREITPRDQSIL